MSYQPVSEIRYPEGSAWYVVYARSRSEKKVVERMERAGIICYLPLIKVMRQWSDRRKMVEVPLFSGYIFVRTDPAHFSDVRMVEGVVNFVRSDGRNAIVPDDQISAIELFLETGLPGETAPDDLAPGERVRIGFGPLSGCEGELMDVRNKRRFVVRVESIGQVLVITLPAEYLEKLS